jgi:hypothetical protein
MNSQIAVVGRGINRSVKGLKVREDLALGVFTI